MKKRIVNQIPLYKGNIGQIYAIPKFIKEDIEKKKKLNSTFGSVDYIF